MGSVLGLPSPVLSSAPENDAHLAFSTVAQTLILHDEEGYEQTVLYSMVPTTQPG